MSGISPVSRSGSDAASAAVDRATVAVSRALSERKREAEAMVRLIEQASPSGKGQVVDYRA